MAKEEKKIRMTVDLTPDEFSSLEHLAASGTKTEALRRSLRLAVTLREHEGEVWLVDEDGGYCKVVFL